MIDVVVIGAGAVGLACAVALTGRGHEVLVLERHDRFGVETSSRNSEVIHAGLYYTPGSLKAELCVGGNPRLYEFCRRYDVPHRRTGKLVLAVTEDETASLESLWTRAAENGVPDLRWVEAKDIPSFEPHVRGVRALFSGSSGVIDSHQLMARLEGLAQARGAQLGYRAAVEGVMPRPGGYELAVADAGGDSFPLEARAVVNSAGLEADRVAAQSGLDIDAVAYRQYYCAGHYYRLSPRHRGRVRHLIYPVPERKLVGLGIHVTVDVEGNLRLGPDAEYLDMPEQDYRFRGGTRAEQFHHAVSRYLSGVDREDLIEDQVGIRPKLQPPGGDYRDFVIREESGRDRPGWVNLVGIESPGLTCSLVIGDRVADLLAPYLDN